MPLSNHASRRLGEIQHRLFGIGDGKSPDREKGINFLLGEAIRVHLAALVQGESPEMALREALNYLSALTGVWQRHHGLELGVKAVQGQYQAVLSEALGNGDN